MDAGATLLFFTVLAGGGSPGPATDGTFSIDPVVAAVARWTVAVQVDREEEPPRVPPAQGKSSLRLPQDAIDYRRRPRGPATGLILDSEGRVLTSLYNVSGKVNSIVVALPSGERSPARIAATDQSDDLALLKIIDPPPGLDIPPVPWADPGKLRVGRFVIVVGRSPDPARPTATFGILSAVDRNGDRAFQTDAEMNYGNAGGPIADLDGSILGIAGFVGHTFNSGLNSGIGFGTKAETVLSVLPALLLGGDVDRPFLGVGMADPTAPEKKGALIGTVQEGSPAEKAGLKPGDAIVSFDGAEIADFMELVKRINRRKSGDEVPLAVERGSERLDFKIRLGKRKN